MESWWTAAHELGERWKTFEIREVNAFLLRDIFGVTILIENLDAGFHWWGFLSDVNILLTC